MKIRLGFVSNSSSSSFVICGFQIHNRETLLKAYQIAGVELDEDQIALVMEGSRHELPEFPLLDLKGDEYDDDDITVGVNTDPEYFSVDDCVNGFVGNDQYELLKKIAEGTGARISVTSGTEYC